MTRVALVQGAAYGDPASFAVPDHLRGYIDQIEQVCREQRPQLVVLPELFLVPYFCSSHDPTHFGLAEAVPGPTTAALGELAREYETYIAAPVFERGIEGEYYDSCALIGPDGELFPGRLAGSTTTQVCARKVHLPNVHAFGEVIDEKFWFRPGAGLSVFETELGRIGILICYDRSFSEAWRTLVLAGAELIVVPVASHGFREALFVAELQTMAAQNGVYAIACNRVGPERVEHLVHMFGNSCVISPLGEIVARASASDPEVLTVDVDLDAVSVARAQMPYLRDRRPDCYTTVSALDA
jgi:N-carbamoylputrescine amidase